MKLSEWLHKYNTDEMDRWADEAAQLESDNAALKEEIKRAKAEIDGTKTGIAAGIECEEKLMEQNAVLQRQVKGLREALCNCGLADATTLPNTHEFSCQYRVVMRRQEAMMLSDEIRKLVFEVHSTKQEDTTRHYAKVDGSYLIDWASRVQKLEQQVERLRETQNSIVERAERILEGEKWNLAEFVVRETKE